MQAQARLIYLVEDDGDIAELVREALTTYGFRADHFAAGEAALGAIRAQAPDLCILDLGLPDIDGMELIDRIREHSAVPIIILSGRGHSSDRILALESGADDYVVKPFEPREIVARVRSVLRRMQSAASSSGTGRRDATARFSGWRFDPASHQLTAPDGGTAFLSTAESVLLTALLNAPNRVLSRDYLLDNEGRDSAAMDRSIDVRISRLRKKLRDDQAEPLLIRTVYGSGYMLTAKVEWSAR